VGLEPEELAGAGAAEAGDAGVLPPRLEKFQSPAADCSRVISGWSTVSDVTLSWRDVISGHN